MATKKAVVKKAPAKKIAKISATKPPRKPVPKPVPKPEQERKPAPKPVHVHAFRSHDDEYRKKIVMVPQEVDARYRVALCDCGERDEVEVSLEGREIDEATD